MTLIAALAEAWALTACTSAPPVMPAQARAQSAGQIGDGMPADWTLDSVVIVSRHGVRSPTRPKPPLESLSPDPWPSWPVPTAYLTPRGGALVEQMGRDYGDWLRARHVLPQGRCPASGVVYAWADVDQRTRLTSEAVLRGMAPGCTIPTHHLSALDAKDPIMHSTESGACTLDPEKARRAIDERLGKGGLDTLNRRYAASLKRLGEILRFSQSPYCREHGDGACDFARLPHRVNIDAQGRHIKLNGPVGIASTVSEVFLLEYAQGMPASQVAWGRIRDDADWARLLETHNAQFDLMAKTPYIAQRKGTLLLAQVLGTLEQRAGMPQPLPTHAERRSRVYFLAAHDTNLAALAGMLKLDWTLPDQPDNTGPGSALVFSLWRAPHSALPYVRVELLYQSLDQLRQLTPLSLTTPAKRRFLPLPGCTDASHGGACRIDAFAQQVRASLAEDCLSAAR